MATDFNAVCIDANGNFLGVLTNEKKIVPVKLETLTQNQILQLKRFPLVMADKKNKLTPVPGKKLEILAKYGTTEDRIAGCDIKLPTGRTRKIPIAELQKMIRYLKCDYTVRRKGDLLVIAGNKGYSEQDIKFIQLHPVKKAEPIKTKYAQVAEKVTKSDKYSLLDILDFLQEAGGAVILLESDRYTARNPQQTVPDDAFTDAHAGGISEPYIRYSSKLNCTLPFVRPGYVQAKLSISDSPVKVPTYVHRNKTLFINGITPNMSRFGAAVPPAYVDLFKKQFGAFIKNEFTATPGAQQLLRTANRNSCICFELDVSTVAVMLKEKAPEYICEPHQLRDMLLRQNELKYVDSLAKTIEYKAKDKTADIDVGRILTSDAAPALAPFIPTIDDTRILMDLGIDIAHGGFTAYRKTSDRKHDTQDTGTVSDITFDIKLSPDVPLKDNPVTDMTAGLIEQLRQADAEIASAVSPEGIIDYQALTVALAHIADIRKAISSKQRDITKKLWLHKTACMCLGDNVKFYAPSDWEDATSGRARKNKSYASTAGVIMTVSASIPRTEQIA